MPLERGFCPILGAVGVPLSDRGHGLILDCFDRQVELTEVTGRLDGGTMVREGVNEWRTVFEEHSLQGFQFQADIAQGRKQFVNVVGIGHARY